MAKLIDIDETMDNLAKANMSRTGNEFERFLLSQSTVEAIPKDQYETRLKADITAVLTELSMEIDELPNHKLQNSDWKSGYVHALADVQEKTIEPKISALKAECAEAWIFQRCPFCGSNDIVAKSEVKEHMMGGANMPCSSIRVCWGHCNYCGADGPKRTGDLVYDSEVTALSLESWNRRA